MFLFRINVEPNTPIDLYCIFLLLTRLVPFSQIYFSWDSHSQQVPYFVVFLPRTARTRTLAVAVVPRIWPIAWTARLRGELQSTTPSIAKTRVQGQQRGYLPCSSSRVKAAGGGRWGSHSHGDRRWGPKPRACWALPRPGDDPCSLNLIQRVLWWTHFVILCDRAPIPFLSTDLYIGPLKTTTSSVILFHLVILLFVGVEWNCNCGHAWLIGCGELEMLASLEAACAVRILSFHALLWPTVARNKHVMQISAQWYLPKHEAATKWRLRLTATSTPI